MKTIWTSNLETEEQKKKFQADLESKLLYDPVIERLREIFLKEQSVKFNKLIEGTQISDSILGELRQIKYLLQIIERPQVKDDKPIRKSRQQRKQ